MAKEKKSSAKKAVTKKAPIKAAAEKAPVPAPKSNPEPKLEVQAPKDTNTSPLSVGKTVIVPDGRSGTIVSKVEHPTAGIKSQVEINKDESLVVYDLSLRIRCGCGFIVDPNNL